MGNNLPGNLKTYTQTFYRCDTCGKEWDSEAEGEPWLKHDLDKMPVHGFELTKGGLYLINGGLLGSDLERRGVIPLRFILSDPIMRKQNHEKRYRTTILGFQERPEEIGIGNSVPLNDGRPEYDRLHEMEEDLFENVIEAARRRKIYRQLENSIKDGGQIVRGVLP